MTPKEIKQCSKLLSLTLRHRPQVLHLNLDAQGWTDTDTLISNFNAFNNRGMVLDHALLKEVVENNNKKRFAFNESGSKIRANQGHSIPIDLAYEPVRPPEELYHGTARRFLTAIYKEGLLKRKRHHVHLSADLETARDVGQRHGKPVILVVKALEMHNAGIPFYCSENGVWLTEQVLPQYFEAKT